MRVESLLSVRGGEAIEHRSLEGEQRVKKTKKTDQMLALRKTTLRRIELAVVGGGPDRPAHHHPGAPQRLHDVGLSVHHRMTWRLLWHCSNNARGVRS